MKNQDKYYTPLDLQMQNLAAIDWPAFVLLIGEENIRNAKICLLKGKGKSHNQIANKLSITRRTAEYNCNKCHEKRGIDS
jgi:hypothetical protein